MSAGRSEFCKRNMASHQKSKNGKPPKEPQRTGAPAPEFTYKDFSKKSTPMVFLYSSVNTPLQAWSTHAQTAARATVSARGRADSRTSKTNKRGGERVAGTSPLLL